MNEIRIKAIAATAGVMAALAAFIGLAALSPRTVMLAVGVILMSGIFIGATLFIYYEFTDSFTRRARKRADSNRS